MKTVTERFRRLTLEKDGADWPNRASSHLVEAGGVHWHVQMMGEGPVALLLHGAGAATHSWRDLAPLLAKRYRIIAPDLPGHGFSSMNGARTQSLPGMAKAVVALLDTLGAAPEIMIGHSAGAAVATRAALDHALPAARIIALNGALSPFRGLAGHFLPTMAKALFLNPLAPRYFAWSANRGAVTRLLEGTGSRIDARGTALYARLFGNPAHVEGALTMMAHWDLRALDRDLPRLSTPLDLIVTENDRTVPPDGACKLAARLSCARLHALPRLGHLAHEEDPALFARLIFDCATARD